MTMQLSCWQGTRQANPCAQKAVVVSRPMFIGLDTEIQMAGRAMWTNASQRTRSYCDAGLESRAAC